jgi:hypothetical protein
MFNYFIIENTQLEIFCIMILANDDVRPVTTQEIAGRLSRTLNVLGSPIVRI